MSKNVIAATAILATVLVATEATPSFTKQPRMQKISQKTRDAIRTRALFEDEEEQIFQINPNMPRVVKFDEDEYEIQHWAGTLAKEVAKSAAVSIAVDAIKAGAKNAANWVKNHKWDEEEEEEQAIFKINPNMPRIVGLEEEEDEAQWVGVVAKEIAKEVAKSIAVEAAVNAVKAGAKNTGKWIKNHHWEEDEQEQAAIYKINPLQPRVGSFDEEDDEAQWVAVVAGVVAKEVAKSIAVDMAVTGIKNGAKWVKNHKWDEDEEAQWVAVVAKELGKEIAKSVAVDMAVTGIKNGANWVKNHKWDEDEEQIYQISPNMPRVVGFDEDVVLGRGLTKAQEKNLHKLWILKKQIDTFRD